MPLQEGITTYRCNQFGYNVIAPILNPYVKWVMNQALWLNLDTLYFLSRDGEIMLDIAKKIKHNNTNYSKLNLEYLYVSRRALIPTYYTDDLEELFQFMQLITDKVTIQEFYHRFNIYDESTSNKLITWNYLYSIIDNQEISNKLIAKINEIKNNALEYFSFIDTSAKFAVVDIGWSGRIQDVLMYLLDSPIYGFYFYTHNKSYLKRSYLKNLKFEDKFWDKLKLLEAICICKDNQVVSYSNGYPVFSNINSGFPNNIVEDIRNGILLNGDYNIPVTKSLEILTRFINKPTVYEIEIFKHYYYSSLDCEYNISSMVQQYTLKDLLKYRFIVERDIVRWHSASYLISRSSFRKMIEVVRLLKYIRYLIGKRLCQIKSYL